MRRAARYKKLLLCLPFFQLACDDRPVDRAVTAQGSAGELFREVSASSGVKFKHDPGANGQYVMPEQVGSGCAIFDYDNDGLLDLYFVQCGGPQSGSSNQLFKQVAPWKFQNVSAGSGLETTGYGMGVATGDINNDGWSDVALTEYGRSRLFLNRAGRFEEITSSAGLDNPRWGTAVSFVDYDRDGWLDLVIGNYVDYNPTQKCFDAANLPEYCGPHSFPGTVARLYRNRGMADAPRFEDVTVAAGFAKANGAALGVLCADFNGDRWPDIFLADDGRPNRLFINQQNGTFREEAAQRGVAFTGMGSVAANMGVAPGDIDRNGLFDFFVTHLATEQHTLWMQQSAGIFQDETARFGLTNPKWKGTGFGALLADLNNDGWLDLAFVNGAVRRAAFPGPRLESLDSFWSPYAQRNQVFLFEPPARFVDVSESNAAFSGYATVARGLAQADLDADGALDLVVMNTSAYAQVFRNVGVARGNWLSVRAIDPARGGRDALGAELRVKTEAGILWQLVQTSYSYLSASAPAVHFGLGGVSEVAEVRASWPDGTEETFPCGAVNRQITLRKGSGKAL